MRTVVELVASGGLVIWFIKPVSQMVLAGPHIFQISPAMSFAQKVQCWVRQLSQEITMQSRAYLRSPRCSSQNTVCILCFRWKRWEGVLSLFEVDVRQRKAMCSCKKSFPLFATDTIPMIAVTITSIATNLADPFKAALSKRLSFLGIVLRDLSRVYVFSLTLHTALGHK